MWKHTDLIHYPVTMLHITATHETQPSLPMRALDFPRCSNKLLLAHEIVATMRKVETKLKHRFRSLSDAKISTAEFEEFKLFLKTLVRVPHADTLRCNWLFYAISPSFCNNTQTKTQYILDVVRAEMVLLSLSSSLLFNLSPV